MQNNIPNPSKHRTRDNIVVGTCNFLLNTLASKEYLKMFRTTVGLGLSALDEIQLQEQREKALAEAKRKHSVSVPVSASAKSALLTEKQNAARNGLTVHMTSTEYDNTLYAQYAKQFLSEKYNLSPIEAKEILNHLMEENVIELLPKNSNYIRLVSKELITCKFDSNPVIPGTKLCKNHRAPSSIPSSPPYTKEMHETGNKLLTWLETAEPNFLPTNQTDAYAFLTRHGLTWFEAAEVMRVLKNMELILFTPDMAAVYTSDNIDKRYKEGSN